MNAFDLKKDGDFDGGEEVYSKPVRAGRRTYFFDVKATRNDDYYLTITESRKKQGRDGSVYYDKHKLFLYKEDFQKFAEGLEEVVAFVKEHKPDFFEHPERYAVRSREQEGEEAEDRRETPEEGDYGYGPKVSSDGEDGTVAASSHYAGMAAAAATGGGGSGRALTADEEFDSL